MSNKLPGLTLIIGLLTAITILFFFPAIFSSGQFFFGDMSQNHYPSRKLIDGLQEGGNIPLWNPYVSGGQPLYANPSHLVFHPISLLFLILPFESAFKSSIILQYLLCAIGMYLLSKELGFSKWAALLSSMAFTFSGFLLSLGHLYNLLGSAAWIPIFLFLFYRAIHRSFYYWPGASLLFVVILMAADPFFIIITVLLSFTLILVQPFRAAPREAFRRFGQAVLIIGSAMLLSCFFLLPTLEMLSLSERGAGLSSDIVGKWSLKPVEMLGLFVPNIFGDPFRLPINEYWGAFHFKEVIPLFLSPYMGLCVLFLAILPFFKWDRFAIVFCILMIFSLFLALGANNPALPASLWKVPFLSSFRYTSKFLLLFTFPVALLAGRGLDQLLDFQEGRDRRQDGTGRRNSLLIFPILVTIGLGLLYGSGLFLPSFFHEILGRILYLPRAIPETILSSISSQFLGKVLYASGIALIGSLLIFLALYLRLKKSIVGWLFLAVVGCDLFIVNGGLNPIAERYFYATPSPFLKVLAENDQRHRIYRENTPKDLMLRISKGWKKEGFFWNRMALLQWTALPSRLLFAFDQNVDRLEPHAPNILRKQAQQRGWLTWKKILDLSSVQYLLLFRKVQDPDLMEMMEFSSMSNHPVVLYQNSAAFPRFFAVPHVRTVHNEERALKEVLSESFRPEQEAIILAADEDPHVKGTIKLAPRTSGKATFESVEEAEKRERSGPHDFCKIEVQEITNNNLRLMIQAEQPGFLVVSDTFYPGWICRMDDHEVPIYVTNFIHRGVAFQKGKHAVEFHFRPKIFYTGILISFVSLSAIIGCLVFLYIRKRRAH
jgi:hypothetical protein